MEFKIDREIKIPNVGKYPFREMKVGDSFLFNEDYTRHSMTKISNAGRAFAYKSKDCSHYKFCVRKEGDKIRIWRIE